MTRAVVLAAASHNRAVQAPEAEVAVALVAKAEAVPRAVARARRRCDRALTPDEAWLASTHRSAGRRVAATDAVAGAIGWAQLREQLAGIAGVAGVAVARAHHALPALVTARRAARRREGAVVARPTARASAGAVDAGRDRGAVGWALGSDGEHRHELEPVVRKLHTVRGEFDRIVRQGTHTMVLLVWVAGVQADDATHHEAIRTGDGQDGVSDGGCSSHLRFTQNIGRSQARRLQRACRHAQWTGVRGLGWCDNAKGVAGGRVVQRMADSRCLRPLETRTTETQKTHLTVTRLTAPPRQRRPMSGPTCVP